MKSKPLLLLGSFLSVFSALGANYSVTIAPGSTGYTMFSDQLPLTPNDLANTQLGLLLSPTAKVYTWDVPTQTFFTATKARLTSIWNSDPILSPGEGFYCIDPNGTGISVPFSGTAISPVAIPNFTPDTLYYLLGSQTYTQGATYSFSDITGYTAPATAGVSLYRAKTTLLGHPPIISTPMTYPGDWNEFWYDGTSWHPAIPNNINPGEAVWIGPSSCAIQGTVMDTHGNPFANCEVSLSDGQFTYTDSGGNYRFAIPSTGGEYTVAVLPPCDATAQTLPQSVSAICPGPTIVPPFVVKLGGNNRADLVVTIIYVPDPGNPAFPCPNDTGSYYVYYYNKCAASPSQTPTLQVTLSPYAKYGYNGPGTPSWSQVSGPAASGFTVSTGAGGSQTLNWTLTSLPVSAIGVIQIPIKVNASINQVMTTIATISPIPGDGHQSDNTSISSLAALCSFDPNSKTVEPAGCGPTGLINNQPLTYTIQFQNVGSAPAFQVVVNDQLDPSLDPSTLQTLGASANYVFNLTGNQMTWTFPNIYLQDATDDLQASYGFITYQVQPLAGLADGTVITNQASIVFDENPPVLTATTTNTITSATMPSASFTVTPRPGSADKTNDFTYAGGTAGATFLWNFGPNAIPPTSTDMNPSGVVFPMDGLSTINLQVSSDGCTSTPASYLLNVGVPVLNITPTDTNQFVLSWEGDGYSLQQTSILTNPVPWQTISTPLTQVRATYFTSPIGTSNVTTFFRLTDHP